MVQEKRQAQSDYLLSKCIKMSAEIDEMKKELK
jgi:hypothetical protein